MNKPNTIALRIVPLHNQSSFTEWSRTIRLALHEQGNIKYITNNYTVVVDAVDKHDIETMLDLFETLGIEPDNISITITSNSVSGEKSSAASSLTKKDKSSKCIPTFADAVSLQTTRKICKGR